jgi:hypothetical protein
MKKIASLLALAMLSLPLAARAQVGVQIHVALPAAMPMVVVQPGVQVVENQDEEVFFTNGWYWVRRDEVWYRAARPHAAFAYVAPRRVPVALVRMEPGRYRHFHHEERHDRGGWHKEHDRGHGHGHHDRHHD